MKKYLYGFKFNFLTSFNYRFNTAVSLLFSNLRLLITIIFWALIYGGDMQKVLNGFTLSAIITYMIFMDLFGTISFLMRDSGFEIAAMIKSGALGPAMLKPQNLGASLYFRNFAAGVTALIPQAAFVLCAMPFAARYLVWGLSAAGAASILLFLVAGTVTAHLLNSILGYMAFWLEEANAVMWSFAVLLNFLMGFFIPIDFFPKWSIAAIEMLPVASWGYIQTKIYIGLYPAEKQLLLLAVQCAWIAALLAANALIWNRGVRKFSSVGA